MGLNGRLFEEMAVLSAMVISSGNGVSRASASFCQVPTQDFKQVFIFSQHFHLCLRVILYVCLKSCKT